jgi:hypothetical protein
MPFSRTDGQGPALRSIHPSGALSPVSPYEEEEEEAFL